MDRANRVAIILGSGLQNVVERLFEAGIGIGLIWLWLLEIGAVAKRGSNHGATFQVGDPKGSGR